MYVIRPMQLRDIAEVMVVNRRCFPSPWSPWAIRFDCEQNPYSKWIVLETHTPEDPNRFGKLWKKFNPTTMTTQIFGFGAFWLINGEAHITNIGVDPAYRGMGWGEALLISMLRSACEQEASFTSLEVRISNQPAINLYEKYAFQIVGRKADYYRDNREDAHIMATGPLNMGYRHMLERHMGRLERRLEWHDYFSRRVEYEA
jgi:ribosomal-protein-alanine N-acetyltransferase